MSELKELQAEMEASISKFVEDLNNPDPGGVCHMLAPEFVTCDYKARRVTVRFPVREWMRNPGGVMHGGAVASALDTAMGCHTFFWAGNSMTPTINMLCNFMRPIKMGSMLYVTTHITYVGRSMLYATAEAYADDLNEPLVTAQGVYHVPSKSHPRQYISFDD